MKRIPLFSLILAAAACGGGAQLSLSARAGTTASTQSAAGATQQALTVNSGITVDRLRIVVREVELERASAQPDDTRDAQEFEAGPFVIDLGADALSGTGAVKAQVSAAVPAGTYRELKFKIHKPGSSESSDAGVQAMAAQNASIVVEGKLTNGQPYTFTSAVEAEQKFEGSFTIGSGNSNLTLNIVPSGWFGTAAAPLDPGNASNRSQIEGNIQVSFRVFEDDDRDGHDDGAGHR